MNACTDPAAPPPRGSSPGPDAPLATVPPARWVIEPRRPGIASRLAELWRGRTLFGFFARRALAKAYRRTVLGWLWLLIRPLAGVAAATLVFGHVVRVDTGPVPYFLFFLVGTSAWMLFEGSLTWVTRSLEINRKLLKRHYFPRIIVPVATLAPALVEFAIHLALIGGAGLLYAWRAGESHLRAGWPLAAALAAVALQLAIALGMGLFTAIFETKARDVRLVLGYALRPLYLLTPVIYPLKDVPEGWRWLAELNPLAVAVETFRFGILGTGELRAGSLAIFGAVALGALMVGLVFFDRAEASAVDQL